MNNVTILVNSCDKYEDAWEPFFRLLKIHWPECADYRIILNTETKVYNCDFLNVETICGGKDISWSKRLNRVLLKINTETILMLMEDFFLKSKLDNDEFLRVIKYMENHTDVGYISVKYKPLRLSKNNEIIEEGFISRDLLPVNYRLPLIAAIWRKEFILKIIRMHESPWEFEQYAGIRSKKYAYKVLDINNNEGFYAPIYDYDIDWEYGVGITHGQWLPKNKEFFEKYGIKVNFDNLGINYKLYEDAINPPVKEKQKEIQSIQKLDLRERLYNIKKWPKKQKEKTIKTIRKIMSLI